MRLRITVQRHGLPPTPIIWSVDKPESTVSELLEVINDVVPIEAGEWGLEDYAVEVKGVDGNYECLHFLPLAKVMKDEDEVIIRPLLTHDIRVRRISGRSQISGDGRHLVDGIAFGRPMLRRPVNRPSISIPPRKRRRITSEEEEAEEDEQRLLAGNPVANLNEPRVQINPQGKQQGLILDEADHDDDDDDDGDYLDDGDLALAESDDEDSEEDAGDVTEGNKDRQLAILANLSGDSSDDEDFSLSQASTSDEEKSDADSVEEADQTNKVGRAEDQEPFEDQEEKDEFDEPKFDDEDALAGIKNKSLRSKIRKLRTAFPTAPVGLVEQILEDDRCQGDISGAYEALALMYKPAQPRSALSKNSTVVKPRTRLERKRSAPVEDMNLDEHNGGSEDNAPEEPEDELLQRYDHRGLPPGSILSGKALLAMAKVANKDSPGRGRANSRSIMSSKINLNTANSANRSSSSRNRRSTSICSNKSAPFAYTDNVAPSSAATPAIDGSSSEAEVSDDTNEEDSDSSDDNSEESSEESSSDSSSDDQSEKLEGEVSDGASSGGDVSDDTSSSSDSSSDASSESSSDDEGPEEYSSKIATANKFELGSAPSASPVVLTSHPLVPPGKGKKSTQSRNARRRAASALSKLKDQGVLPPDTTTKELVGLKTVKSNTSADEAQAALQALRSAKIKAVDGAALAKLEEFEARRRELLASLETGGIEISPSIPAPQKKPLIIEVESIDSVTEDTSATVSNANIDADADAPFSTAPEMQDPSDGDVDTKSISITAVDEGPAPASKPAQSSSSAPPRRIDVGAASRLIFGPLGHKPPKNKKDEEALRNKLMKDVRPLPARSPGEDNSYSKAAVDEDPAAWKEKVIYRAVECGDSSIVLSEPPFPFVQRWDPQQRSCPKKGGGKRKGVQYDEPECYDAGSRLTKKQRRRKARQESLIETETQEYLDASYQPSYQEDSMDIDSAQLTQDAKDEDAVEEVADQSMNDAYEGIEDDLPELPADVASLPNLELEKARAGMLIAFKQLDEPSEATMWQPMVSPYRTAEIAEINGSTLLIKLAKRDQYHPEKQFDEDGSRVYGRYEMPVDDDDDDDYVDGQDDSQAEGLLELVFHDLMEPKIVAATPEFVENTSQQAGTDERSANSKEEEPYTEYTHVTETTLGSDAPVASEANVDEDVTLRNLTEASSQAIEPELITENITTETRHHVQGTVKEADCRSSSHSSHLKSVQPNSVTTVSDTSALEKPRKDILASEGDGGMSPKFNGFGSSSPVRHAEEPTILPDGPQSSWQTVASQDDASSRAAQVVKKSHAQGDSTIQNRIVFSIPDGTQTWPAIEDTQDAERQASSLPILEEVSQVTDNQNQEGSSSQPIMGAQRKRSIGSLLKNGLIKGARAFGMDGVATISPDKTPDMESDFIPLETPEDNSAQDPPISNGSSFGHSQVTDHGRQPDYDFDLDNSTIMLGTPKQLGGEDMDDGDSGPQLPPHKTDQVDTLLDIAQEEPSSDDPFPTLEDLTSQVQPRKIVAAVKAEPQDLPRLKQLNAPAPKGIQVSRPARPSPSQSHITGSQSAASQVIDLSLDSSSDLEDNHPDAVIAMDDSDDEQQKTFKMPADIEATSASSQGSRNQRRRGRPAWG